ncbi:hypothetical protein SCHPADRAFT_351060 [Schizopora paradoxa]|uniref:MYND-type domain-containing protein n=1 Tax=Schizopora paradoxa TaxID=27342 RepID=A0A0H2RWD0_9AGAM|nr:hypothetical protein SCHPADRAFT_351060 [Schizopora paradoxa]
MTALMECAHLAFAFEPIDRDKMVELLKALTLLTLHIPIARQASAELEKLERRCSVQARFHASTLDVRNAWVTFYDTILARRTILAHLQNMDSTPMTCDNCFRFDERANFKKCAGCGMAHYCSKDCQKSAWKEKGHRNECKTHKDKPTKRKSRAISQEKYFLARVAHNDALRKKEYLKQIAQTGLKYVAVTVDYMKFPPRCTVACDMEELQACLDEIPDISERARNLIDQELDRCVAPRLSSEGASGLPPTLRTINRDGMVEVVDSEGDGVCYINLVDDDAETHDRPIGPPVNLTVYHPTDGMRRERKDFVFDYFWEFANIKFENPDHVDRSELLRLEEEYDQDKHSVVSDGTKHSPESERMEAVSFSKSRTALEAEEEAETERLQNELMRVIK